ncbi:hypothetical protein [Mangrovimonas xylaniphaga]|uniref:hypothetical protein n=1 Tax=Mangrovimonas xylaniphaga TaxID=1645915 RepID=UPI0006B5455B|nr:hypothetical protein [Mangrovimonas xylaniphaga]
MKPIITEDRIQELYAFTRQHFVVHYDIQTELVDHLANGIEAQWEEHPLRTFEDALHIEFKKFGVFGFQDVVEQRTKALTKYYWKEVWRLFKQYFRLPKIIMTVALVLMVQMLLKFSPYSGTIFYGFVCLLFLLPVFKIWRFGSRVKKRRKSKEKHYLFEDIILSLGTGGFVLQIPLQFLLHFHNRTELNFDNPWVLWIGSSFVVFYGFVMYLVAFYIPKHMEENMKKMYPEYTLV